MSRRAGSRRPGVAVPAPIVLAVRVQRRPGSSCGGSPLRHPPPASRLRRQLAASEPPAEADARWRADVHQRVDPVGRLAGARGQGGRPSGSPAALSASTRGGRSVLSAAAGDRCRRRTSKSASREREGDGAPPRPPGVAPTVLDSTTVGAALGVGLSPRSTTVRRVDDVGVDGHPETFPRRVVLATDRR